MTRDETIYSRPTQNSLGPDTPMMVRVPSTFDCTLPLPHYS